MTEYINDILPVYESKQVESKCAQITFVNKGSAPCTINTYPLQPGESLSFSGNENEIDISIYQVVFNTTGFKLLYVIRKLYKK